MWPRKNQRKKLLRKRPGGDRFSGHGKQWGVDLFFSKNKSTEGKRGRGICPFFNENCSCHRLDLITQSTSIQDESDDGGCPQQREKQRDVYARLEKQISANRQNNLVAGGFIPRGGGLFRSPVRGARRSMGRALVQYAHSYQGNRAGSRNTAGNSIGPVFCRRI